MGGKGFQNPFVNKTCILPKKKKKKKKKIQMTYLFEKFPSANAGSLVVVKKTWERKGEGEGIFGDFSTKSPIKLVSCDYLFAQVL